MAFELDQQREDLFVCDGERFADEIGQLHQYAETQRLSGVSVI
jgi:hypothetical protein